MAAATATHPSSEPSPAEANPRAAKILADLRTPLVANGHSLSWITDNICRMCEEKTPRWWWICLVPSVLLMISCFACFGYLIMTGVGVWGQNIPVAWAWDITNFVFWIGIGHAGTLISAILFLTRQRWRTAVNRAAEAMTLFAVVCAGLYPGLHVGRVWMAWMLAPVPNQYAIWPNFKSPLLWDVFAVSTYFTVSVLFWFTGLIPDLATLRDRARTRGNMLAAYAYGFFALGWRGGNRQWRHYEMAYLLLAALSTPLVLSVHTIVSFDFATSVVPGWHTTIFPPYFVAGAIFGGFAMVLTLMIPLREFFYPQLKDMITARHIDVMAKIILMTGSIVGYAYIMEFFVAWYGGNMYEVWAFLRSRVAGPVTDLIHFVHPAFPKLPWAPYWWAYYCMMSFNVLSPQFFWFKWCRRNIWFVFFICQFVNAGMWFERFVIIVTSIARDFLPSSWGIFHPSWVDMLTFAGSFGLFLTLFLIFIRFLPMIAIAEVKGVTPMADPHSGHGHAYGYAAGPQPEPTHLTETPHMQDDDHGLRKRAVSSAAGDVVPATSGQPAQPIDPRVADEGRQ
ncbi:MAG: polysulfide reductase NrfD [Rhodospirillales bacterium]|nr:polysulfide reductase NrfD [Acetobacter sp.]